MEEMEEVSESEGGKGKQVDNWKGSSPAILGVARRALEEAEGLPRIASLIDQAEVVRVAARAAGLSTEAQNDWTRYKIDCERAAAEAIERMRVVGELAEQGHPVAVDKRPTLGHLNVDRRRAAEWEKLASIPIERLEEEFREASKAGRAVSEAGLLRVAREGEREKVETPRLPEGEYDVILADPPWRYSNSGGLPGQAENHYATMDLEAIKGLEVPAAADAALFLWVTNPMIREGLALAEAWGFEYKTNVVWVKTELQRPGVGFYVRGRHELLFICTKGRHVPEQRGRVPIGSVLEAPIGSHSTKPEGAYELIEAMYPGERYLELFARRNRSGWTAWGADSALLLAGVGDNGWRRE